MKATTVSLELKWTKIRLDAAARSTLDRAVADVNRRLEAPVHLVRHPSGRVLVCRVADLWFCHVGAAESESPIWTLAVDTRPEQRTLLPARLEADFAECCDILGLRTAGEHAAFRAFLTPQPH